MTSHGLDATIVRILLIGFAGVAVELAILGLRRRWMRARMPKRDPPRTWDPAKSKGGGVRAPTSIHADVQVALGVAVVAAIATGAAVRGVAGALLALALSAAAIVGITSVNVALAARWRALAPALGLDLVGEPSPAQRWNDFRLLAGEMAGRRVRLATGPRLRGPLARWGVKTQWTLVDVEAPELRPDVRLSIARERLGDDWRGTWVVREPGGRDARVADGPLALALDGKPPRGVLVVQGGRVRWHVPGLPLAPEAARALVRDAVRLADAVAADERAVQGASRA